MNKEYWIQKLGLLPHPEGGYYKEVFRSAGEINLQREEISVSRNTLTSIYFLLGSDDRSVFHRLQSDEIWYYHAGDTVAIYVLSPGGELTEHLLGPEGEMQVVIPQNHWFGALVSKKDTYILVSCAVAPGFDFSDFEMAERVELIQAYPQHTAIIQLLT